MISHELQSHPDNQENQENSGTNRHKQANIWNVLLNSFILAFISSFARLYSSLSCCFIRQISILLNSFISVIYRNVLCTVNVSSYVRWFNCPCILCLPRLDTDADTTPSLSRPLPSACSPSPRQIPTRKRLLLPLPRLVRASASDDRPLPLPSPTLPLYASFLFRLCKRRSR